jgi:hypothetical protein
MYNSGVSSSLFLDFLSKLLGRFAPAPMNAAQRWQTSGGTQSHAFWVFAHPVHLLLARDYFVLPEPAPLLVSSDEANAVVESLNQHFSTQGMCFYVQENQWLLGLDFDPKISTTWLKNALNQDVTPYLPQGEGTLAWAKISNEIQMLLFSHPVNAAREVRGELPINSLWFDGLSQAV